MRGPLHTAFALSFTFGMSVTGVAASSVDRSGWLTRGVARAWGTYLCRVCGVPVTVRGGEAVDWSGTFIVMANHQSYFDIPVLYASLPRACGMLAKKELFRLPVFRSAMKGVGCVPIDRSNRRQSLDSLREAAEQVRCGQPIVVFPEGTRSPDGRVYPLKKGAFHLAEMAQVPIVPVGINGTRNVLARETLIIRGAPVNVTIGRPLLQEKKGPVGRERLRKAVQEALAELSGYDACPEPALHLRVVE